MKRDNKKVGSVTGIDRAVVPGGSGYKEFPAHQHEVKQAHQEVFRQLLILSRLRLGTQTLVSFLDREKKR